MNNNYIGNKNIIDYLQKTLPPMILKAGVPLIKQSRAKILSHSGHVQGVRVKSLLIRSLKHLSKAPLPPLRYLNSRKLQPLQQISTVLLGPFLFGFDIVLLYLSNP